MPDAFDGNYAALVREMAAAARAIDDIPEDHEFTQEQLATFEDVRGAALRLARQVEALIETFEGS